MGFYNYGIGVGIALVFCYLATKKRRNDRLPPGPKPLPLIGNLLNMPTQQSWLTFTKWKEQYGDIVYLEALNQRYIILNSLQVCNDLLEKRSKKYSGRPQFIMLSDPTLVGWDYTFTFFGYTPRWRLHRRFFHQYFNEAQSEQYVAIQEQKLHAFLRNLLKQPDIFRDHIRLFFAETIMEIVYGYPVKDHQDKFLKIVATAMHAFSQCGQAGKFYVEVFPFLKYVPSWLPGAGFKRQAAEWKQYVLAQRDHPASYVQQQVESGAAKPSILGSMISRYDEEKIGTDVGESMEDAVKGVCGTAYAGGSDTTLSSFEGFFLAMANYPECQKAAQAELDAVVGGSRLPTLEDKKDLPYIEAIMKEILRWHIILPGSVPHALSEDDEYIGYFMPKGSVIIPNVWAMFRDPNIYPDPDTFNPSRWLIDTPEGRKLNGAIPDPDAAFGFGRRICPGRYFAENALFLGIACVLATFTISPLDANGMQAERCEEGITDGILVYPAPYNVSIKPRSSAASRLISETE